MVVTMNNTAQAVTGEEPVAESFLKSLSLLEQAHRRLHDVVKDDLERGGERHLTGVQALLIYEIGEGETPASVLRARGAFAGTSLSYNIKKLQEGGYLEQSRSEADKRTVHLRILLARPADANAEIEPPAGQEVDGRDLFSERGGPMIAKDQSTASTQ